MFSVWDIENSGLFVKEFRDGHRFLALFRRYRSAKLAASMLTKVHARKFIPVRVV